MCVCVCVSAQNMKRTYVFADSEEYYALVARQFLFCGTSVRLSVAVHVSFAVCVHMLDISRSTLFSIDALGRP